MELYHKQNNIINAMIDLLNPNFVKPIVINSWVAEKLIISISNKAILLFLPNNIIETLVNDLFKLIPLKDIREILFIILVSFF